MPIPVLCPGCRTQLNAPDATAGKKVRCPSCRAAVPVPGAAPAPPATPAAAPEPLSLDDEPAPAPPARKSGAAKRPPARRRRDDDGDGRRMSFRERREAQAAGPPVALVLAAAGLIGLGIVGGVAYTAYALFFSGNLGGTAGGKGGKAPVPAGWKEHTARAGGFKAYIPGDAVEFPVLPATLPRANGQPLVAGGQMISATAENLEVGVVAIGVRFQGGGGADRERVLDELIKQNFDAGGAVQETGRREVTWLGHKAREVVLSSPGDAGFDRTEMVLRAVVVGSHGYVGGVVGKNRRANPEHENGFFDNFEALAEDSSAGGGRPAGGGGVPSGSPAGGGKQGAAGAPPAGGKAPVPAGWKEYTTKDGGFKAYIPGDPLVDSPNAELAPVRKGGKSPINGGRMVLALGPNEEANIAAFGVRFQVASPLDRDRALEQLVTFLKEGGRGARGVERGRRDITWLGQKAKEIVIRFPASGPKAEQDLIVRTVVVGSYGYVAAIGGRSGRPRPEDENGFFDNFEPLK